VHGDRWQNDERRGSKVAPKNYPSIDSLGVEIYKLSLLEQKYQVIKTPRLDNLFTQPELDIDDFLSKEGPFRSKINCLTDFQMEQKSLDRETRYASWENRAWDLLRCSFLAPATSMGVA
jgi:hypothetical protein